ncbi:ROK family protein [Pelodictyon luteolum]|uniref:N-acetylglucosamine kinase n=1 Tax=Chlorobium luteolum (strain DSM 273 / BCRC 81028 / 2530) TaxID=319225 RepID=Q3B112_CHLL3|nr:ROK family protein [Pelodictyon luteolum]ABB24969.1 N-acetylglucosamine kinase [Pelodictyon luteolum DSM 273]
MEPPEQYWGIDLGGTKIEATVIGPEMEELIRMRIPTEADRGYEHILLCVRELLDRVSGRLGLPVPDLIGIGTPGRYDEGSRAMKNSNTVSLNGRDLPADLNEVLGCRVAIENDANCFALAESLHGAAAPFMQSSSSCVFGIILGTGTGGGIVAGGMARKGAHGIAGEWGHNVLIPDGDPCYCGRRGCVETVISGPALERWYYGLSGVELPLEEIARRPSSDLAARQTIGRLLQQFGRALGPVLNILDPDACVIGGGVGNIDALYSEAALLEIERHLFSGRLEIPILRPELGDSAGVIGAALTAKAYRNIQP